MPDLSIRVKNIQKQTGAGQTGTIDLPTCRLLEQRLGITVSGNSLPNHIKHIQRALKITDDGLVGPVTVSRIEALIKPTLPELPAGASMAVSLKTLDALVAFEISSKEAYTKNYQKPTWPGGASGVTIGIGFDVGYCTKQQFTKTWKDILPADAFNAMLTVLGKKGAACKELAASLKTKVKVPYADAIKVFYNATLPLCATDVRNTYPGIEKLPPDAQGAILSLVYNRGPLIDNSDRRKEMKAIKPLIASGNLPGIAAQLRNMKRLWPNAKGLVKRRESEALLIENATYDILPEEIIIV